MKRGTDALPDALGCCLSSTIRKIKCEYRASAATGVSIGVSIGGWPNQTGAQFAGPRLSS